MICEEIEKIIKDHFNKEVRFNTSFGSVLSTTRTFLIERVLESEYVYSLIVRVTEYDTYVEVIKLELIKAKDAEFLVPCKICNGSGVTKQEGII